MTVAPGEDKNVRRCEFFRVFQAVPHAVVGASRDRTKYGNRVLRAFQQHGMTVFPVNPHTDEIEGLKSYPNLTSLPQAAKAISVITPPRVTRSVVEEAVGLGINHIWLQPGSESEEALALAIRSTTELIYGGPCVLVELAAQGR